MKQVAIVGADFVPSSLPPALRVRFFAQHLPEFGWRPIIVTTDPEHYEWSVDPENECLLPDSLEVIRTLALPARFTRKLGIGDIGMRSLWHHWRTLVKLSRERQIDLIFIPVPPSVSMVLGRLLHFQFKIPYVIDYIDPWVTEYYWRLPKAQRPPKWALAYTLSRILEPLSLRRVAHITGVSKGTTDSVVGRYPWLNETDATELPYGGETDDFEYLRSHPRQHRIFDSADEHLHISYVGACIPAMHATVRALFAAVREGLARAPNLFCRLRLHFVGTTYAPDADKLYQVMPLARECGVEEVVDEHPGRVPYLDALQILLDSHGLVVIGSDEPHYTASKVFPYILARKPLLAIFHEASSVVTIIHETRSGDVVTYDTQRPPLERIAQISQCLENILTLPRDYQPQTCWEAFERYTTRSMAGRLAAVFDKIVK